MAERYAVASGNWSALATWDGGVSLPGALDDVYPNGYTVTVDQDVTVTELNNGVGSTAVAGGKFTTSGSVEITATVQGGNSSSAGTFCLELNDGGTLTGNSYGNWGNRRGTGVYSGGVMNGNGYGSTATGSATGVYVLAGGVMNGNGYGGTAGSSGAQVYNRGVINGDGYPGSAGLGVLLRDCGIMNGDAIGGVSVAVSIDTGSVMNGNAIGGSTASKSAVSISNGGVLIGNSTGGSAFRAYGATVSGGGIVIGDVTGGSGSQAYGITINNGTAIIGTATGTVSDAHGVIAVDGDVVIITTESGAYPKSLASGVLLDYTTIPWLDKTAAGGGIQIARGMNGGMR